MAQDEMEKKEKEEDSEPASDEGPVYGPLNYLETRYAHQNYYRRFGESSHRLDRRTVTYDEASGTTRMSGEFSGELETLNEVFAWPLDELDELASLADSEEADAVENDDLGHFQSWESWLPRLTDLARKNAPQSGAWKPSVKPRPGKWVATDTTPNIPDDQDDVDPRDGWPTRLLQVPSMTSYCRAADGTYGGVHNPTYNAISYTWGRFARRRQKVKLENGQDFTVELMDGWFLALHFRNKSTSGRNKKDKTGISTTELGAQLCIRDRKLLVLSDFDQKPPSETDLCAGEEFVWTQVMNEDKAELRIRLLGSHLQAVYATTSQDQQSSSLGLEFKDGSLFTVLPEANKKMGGVQVTLELQPGQRSWRIPQIKPVHFLASQFQTAIQAASIQQGQEYLWLDIACIDQNSDSKEKATEIRRQAKIFAKATCVYIWQTTHTMKFLEQILSTISRASEEAKGSTTDGDMVKTAPWTKAVTIALRALVSDPWWTSLWTLQEAYLCPEAYFLSKDAQICFSGEIKSKGGDDQHILATLQDLVNACSSVVNAHRRSSARTDMEEIEAYEDDEYKAFKKILHEIHDRDKLPTALISTTDYMMLAEERAIPLPPRVAAILSSPLAEFSEICMSQGLDAVAGRNPMALYTASCTRTASRDTDCIYGIQQVFGFTLGVSRPGAFGKRFVLADLEWELGREISNQSAFQSQMHNFSVPACFSSAWRVDLSSYIPPLYVGSRIWQLPSNSLCSLTALAPIDQEGERLAWAQVHGKACVLSSLRAAWRAADDAATATITSSILRVSLDGGSVHGQRPWSLHMWNERQGGLTKRFDKWREAYTRHVRIEQGLILMSNREREHRAAECLDDAFQNKDIRVLLLGSFKARHEECLAAGSVYITASRPEREQFMVGLLIVCQKYRGFDYWHRLGLVAWQISHLADLNLAEESASQLRGEGKEWAPIEGLYG